MSDDMQRRAAALIEDWIGSRDISISDSEKMTYAKTWIAEQVQPTGLVALALIAQVNPILTDLERQAVDEDGPRLVSRVDASHLVKSPESILEKMARAWEDTREPPPVHFDNFQHELRDLGRFRIVTNFLSDAGRIVQALAAPYSDPLPTGLSEAQRRLAGEFALDGGRFADTILVHPRNRRSGERCRKAVFRPREAALAHRCIEVQVLTQLQEAWDKKDHFLAYERTRRGQSVPLDQACEMFAMSELLYVADQTFDRLRTALARSTSQTEAR